MFRKNLITVSVTEDSVIPVAGRARSRILFGRILRRRARNQRWLLDPDEILADSISALHADDILEGKIEKPIGRLSSLLFLVVIGAGMIYLGARAADLQLREGANFYAKSQENRFFARPLYPPRGIISDRYGRPMVENVPSFSIIFEKDRFYSDIKNSHSSSCVSETGIPPASSTPACSSKMQEDFSQRFEEMRAGLAAILAKDNFYFSEQGFPDHYAAHALPGHIVVAQDISVESVGEVSARLDTLPGIQIVESYRRTYEHPFAFSHLAGFTGRLSSTDLEKHPELTNEESIGRAGIEQFYDSILRGKSGKKIVEVNSRGLETRFRLTEQPQEGAPITLTVDAQLQKISYDMIASFTDGTKGGSVVITDVHDGSVRALVSFPGFDINRFSAALSNEEYQTILHDPLKPFFNRAVAGEFPSGSTFKPLMAAAALEEGLIDPHKKIYDEGYIEIPNPYRPGEPAIFKDWKKHGWVNMFDAIAYSANVYFYMIGGGYRDQRGLGVENIKKYAEQFGLNNLLGIDIPGERKGLIPDPKTKKITNPEDGAWRIGDTYNISIGQGGVKTTPLQITAAIAAIANGGVVYAPHVLDSIFDAQGKVAGAFKPVVVREVGIKQEHMRLVREGMLGTVAYGTARALADVPVKVAAKTGTAQAGSGKPHAWVTGFAPYDNPEIAFTVMIEHAGEGSTVAVPITREILYWYFTEGKRQGIERR